MVTAEGWVGGESKGTGEVQLSDDGKAIISGSQLFLREGSENLPNEQLAAQGITSFVRFEQDPYPLFARAIKAEGNTYVQIVPRFNASKLEADEELRAEAELAVTEQSVRNKHYWARTYVKNQPGEQDDSEAPRRNDPMTDDLPMAAPADCEAMSALTQGLTSKGRRKLAYKSGGSEHLVPSTTTEYKSMSPFRNAKGHKLTSSGGQGLADEALLEMILGFIHNPGNGAYLTAYHRNLQPTDDATYFSLAGNGIITFDTTKNVSNTFNLQYRGVQKAKDLYWNLSEAGRQKFDKDYGINQYADLQVGHAYMMATQDDAPGFVAKPDESYSGPWGQHWGTVILDLGRDKVTLEGYAEQGRQSELRSSGVLGQTEPLQVRSAQFAMYAGLDSGTGEPTMPGGTFHRRHLAAKTHGSHAMTFKVVPNP
jgi:hypothetical protein